MFNLGQEIQEILNAFAPLFSKPVWLNAQIMIIGAILCIRKRTVTSTLKVMGLGHPGGETIHQLPQSVESGEIECTPRIKNITRVAHPSFTERLSSDNRC